MWSVGAEVGCIADTAVGSPSLPVRIRSPSFRVWAPREMQELRASYVAIGSMAGLVAGDTIGYVIRSARWAPMADN
jgi:hypothetical protein